VPFAGKTVYARAFVPKPRGAWRSMFHSQPTPEGGKPQIEVWSVVDWPVTPGPLERRQWAGSLPFIIVEERQGSAALRYSAYIDVCRRKKSSVRGVINPPTLPERSTEPW
jgi:hypothetical protein